MNEPQALNIILVDDQPNVGNMVNRIINGLGHRVQFFENGYHALQLPQEELEQFDVALLDMHMPAIDGLELGVKLKERVPHLVSIMLTADTTASTAVKALRDSKFDDYLIKSDLARDSLEGSNLISGTLLRALKLVTARKALKDTELALNNQHQFNEILLKQSIAPQKKLVGNSPSFNKMLDLVRKVAPFEASVLITGETGSGKELVAREIHRRSMRGNGSFVAINCAAIPQDLLESELFGYRKGAFTGATSNREGLIKMADGGTLFLDEIGDMPMGLQAKLLRVLQEREITPLGGTSPSSINVRVISATNQELQTRIRDGLMREDLYYRLNVFPIRVPPLRERLEDLENLILHFMRFKGINPRVEGIAPETLHYLKGQSWPGNVRELENVVERALIVSNGPLLGIEDFQMQLDDGIASTAPTAFVKPAIQKSQAVAPAMPQAVEQNLEILWQQFTQNRFKLWRILNLDEARLVLGERLRQSVYLKKGRFGRLCVKEAFQLELKLNYLHPLEMKVMDAEVRFRFLPKNVNDSFDSSDSVQESSQHAGQNTFQQTVLKGLPDTYLFNMLYPPPKKNSWSNNHPQHIMRALILRYAHTIKPELSLKAVFGDVFDILFDEVIIAGIEGLKHDGLEALRAYLCSNSHLFFGIASYLRVKPEFIKDEIRRFFPQAV